RRARRPGAASVHGRRNRPRAALPTDSRRFAAETLPAPSPPTRTPSTLPQSGRSMSIAYAVRTCPPIGSRAQSRIPEVPPSVRGGQSAPRSRRARSFFSRSQAVSLQPSVQRAAAETERIRRLADISIETRQRLSHQQRLHVLQAHVLEPWRALASRAQ